MWQSGLNEAQVCGMVIHRTYSSAETHAIGTNLGKRLLANSIVCFFGDLGAGKTTFIKGLVEGVNGKACINEVSSPTFTFLNIYPGLKTVYHFDLYRMRDGDEFLSMGFDEMFDAGGVCCVEWSERIEALIPEHALRVVIHHLGGDQRGIEYFEKAAL